jgi:hypothetical protein
VREHGLNVTAPRPGRSTLTDGRLDSGARNISGVRRFKSCRAHERTGPQHPVLPPVAGRSWRRHGGRCSARVRLPLISLALKVGMVGKAFHPMRLRARTFNAFFLSNHHEAHHHGHHDRILRSRSHPRRRRARRSHQPSHAHGQQPTRVLRRHDVQGDRQGQGPHGTEGEVKPWASTGATRARPMSGVAT